MRIVKDLPEGPFHLAVIKIGETGVPISDGEIIKIGSRKLLKNLEKNTTYDKETKVPLFQQTEVSKIITE